MGDRLGDVMGDVVVGDDFVWWFCMAVFGEDILYVRFLVSGFVWRFLVRIFCMVVFGGNLYERFCMAVSG